MNFPRRCTTAAPHRCQPTFFHKHGYVVSIGLCNPLISGLRFRYGEHYQTHLVLAIGILSTLYDEDRMHRSGA